jgi:crotonobetaine/carnitine-CoA ligase
MPHENICRLVAAACRTQPDLPALILEDGITITRRDFLATAQSFAGYLGERVRRGDRVAIMSGNRIEFMQAWLATVANEAILVSINPSAGEADAGHILADSRPAILITDDETSDSANRLAAAHQGVGQVVVLGDKEPDGLAQYCGKRVVDFSSLDIDPATPANVYYTSGTTGLPKGCVLTHEWFMRVADVIMRLYPTTRKDRWLCPLPFYYGDPPWLLLLSLQSGTPMVAMRRFSVSRFWPVVRRHAITRLFSIGAIPNLLLKAAAHPEERQHQVEFALQVGVPPGLQGDLIDRFGFPWLEAYGLTETGAIISMPRDATPERIAGGSIGIACPEVAVRIVDDLGTDVTDGTTGELVVRAPAMMAAYWNRPDATAEVMREGWIHTGDLVRQDADGFFYFLGRKKDLIRRSGENVSAAEVEAVLRSHPQVLDAAVVPVADETRGEEIKAYVLPRDSAEVLSPDDLIDLCLRHLARHKVPRYIEIRHCDFPRTPSMRIAKEKLRVGGVHTVSDAWDRELGLPRPRSGGPTLWSKSN